MIKYLVIIFLLWLLVRRVMRSLLSPPPGARRRARPPYPGPQDDKPSGHDISDFTQQSISDAEFEDLQDDRDREV